VLRDNTAGQSARPRCYNATVVGFIKHFFSHQLFGKREAYTKEIRKASLERLAHLIKVCGFLMQTKVYLFLGSVNSQGLRNKKVEC